MRVVPHQNRIRVRNEIDISMLVIDHGLKTLRQRMGGGRQIAERPRPGAGEIRLRIYPDNVAVVDVRLPHQAGDGSCDGV